MKRTNLNFIVDALAFMAMLFLCSTGLVLAHQLPPGSGSAIGRGAGHGAVEKSVALLWGWSRHQWGDVHYWIAYALLALLAIHVILHWKWIICVARGKPTDASPYRLLVGTVSLIILLILSASPHFSSTTSVKRGDLSPGSAAPERDQSAGAKNDQSDGAIEPPSLRGSMTFQEIADATHIPVADIIRKVGLPDSTAPSDRAGRTLHSAGKEMSDLRRALDLSDGEEIDDAGTK